MAPRRRASARYNALPADAIALVLERLAGDVPSLCAAACVARAWRAAAAQPRLWAHLAQLPPDVAERLTNEDLASLVARAAGGLERLDVSGASQLTDYGFEAAMRQPHALTAFIADSECYQLTGQGVATALAAQRGRMRELSVRGLRCGLEQPDDAHSSASVTAWRAAGGRVIRALRALRAPGCAMDGHTVCEHYPAEPHYMDDWTDGLCDVICGRRDLCQMCGGEPQCDEHKQDDCSNCAVFRREGGWPSWDGRISADDEPASDSRDG